jgi:hypothetical protein
MNAMGAALFAIPGHRLGVDHLALSRRFFVLLSKRAVCYLFALVQRADIWPLLILGLSISKGS